MVITPENDGDRASYPNIALSILVSSHEEIEPALLDDKLDLGIGFGELSPEDIQVMPLHVEHLALIASAQRSSVRKTVMTAAEAASIPLALLDSSFSIRRTVERYFRSKDLRPNIAVEANSILTLIELVRLTDLSTILPENVGGAGGLSIVRMDPAFEPRGAALLRRRNAYCSAAARAFIATTRQVVAKFAEG